MDGWNVVKQLKLDGRTRRIPVVFLTAKTAEIDEVVGLELGGENYLVKPVSIPKLLARIRSVFRRLEERIEVADPKRIVRVGPFEINPQTYKVKLK
ncbi:MAG: response regulator [Bacteroidota bacterium]